MKYSRFGRSLGSATIILLAATFMAACDGGDPQSGTPSEFPRSETLYVGGFQWGPPASFNPLHGTPAWPITGNMNLIYEALFGFNQITGEIEGILGESYVLDGQEFTVKLHPAARWHDSTPVTSEDVAYTFDVHRRYQTNFHGHWNYLSDVKAVDSVTVRFTLDEENYNPLVVKDILASTPIIPKSVFSTMEMSAKDLGEAEALAKIREDRNEKPMASGPYTLENYSDQKIVLVRVDGYWGNIRHDNRQAAPKYLIHSAYKSNDKFNLALQQGDLDISQTFCPQIWNKFDKGVGTWYEEKPYYIPGIIPALLMGLTQEPFDDPAFRRALSYAIDYEKIKNLAMYGYSPDIQPGYILPFGVEEQFYPKAQAESWGKMHDPDKAKAMLTEAGYSWGEDGLLLNPKGEKIRTLYATCPSGWTDWEQTIKIAVTSMREVGVDVREKFVEYPIWDKDLKNGIFDFTMKTPQPEVSPSVPWSRFQRTMSTHDFRPVGEVMYHNEGRFQNERADELLRRIPKLTDDAEIRAAYAELNQLFLDEMPVLPLMYRPWLFYQFNTTHWENFPTEKNAYAPPQCLMVGAGVKALWDIKPRI